jgi:hypothetical protein
MKISRKRLRQIIKEELENIKEKLEKTDISADAFGFDGDRGIATYSEEELQTQLATVANILPLKKGNIIINMPDSEIPEVKKKIVSALDLLAKKAKPEHDLVQKNLDNISSGEKSGIDIKNKKFSIADLSILKQSVAWLASIIFHDAYHVEQGIKGWHGKDRETPANLKQLELLKKLDAAPDEIAHLTKIIKKGDHSDCDGDGDFDLDDLKCRDW